MQNIPLQPIYAQQFNVTLGGQTCVVTVRQRSTGMYFSLVVNGVTLMTEVLCQARVLLVRQPSLGFVGDLAFIDTQGNDEPEWSGLGTRWLLIYFTPADLAVEETPQVSVMNLTLRVDSAGNYRVTGTNNYRITA